MGHLEAEALLKATRNHSKTLYIENGTPHVIRRLPALKHLNVKSCRWYHSCHHCYHYVEERYSSIPLKKWDGEGGHLLLNKDCYQNNQDKW